MALITDDFNRSSGSGLGASWTTSVGSSVAANGWTINGQAATTGGTQAAMAVHNTDPGSPDQFAQAVLGGTGSSVGLFVCATAPTGAQDVALGGYFARHSGANIGIFSAVAGDPAVVNLGNAAHTRVAGQVLRLVRSGSDLIAYINGAEIVRATDGTRSGGLVGLRASGTANATLDDFKAGTLADMAALDGTSGPPSTVVPAQVVNLSAGTPTSTSVPLSWGATSDTTSYLVEYRAGTTGTFLAGPTPTGASSTVTGLTANTAYQFRVIARNAAGSGVPSGVVSVSTTTSDAPPAVLAPSGIPGRGYTINRAGEEILPGEPVHTLRVNAYGPSAAYVPPAWLTAAGTVEQREGDGGYLALKATPGAPASLTLTPGITTSTAAAVWIEMDHVRWSTASPLSASFVLAAGDATVGARLAQGSSEAFARLTNAGTSTDNLLSHMGSDANKRRRIGLLVVFATKEAYTFDGKQMTGYRDCSASWGGGPAPVSVTVSCSSGEVELRLSRLTITTYN